MDLGIWLSFGIPGGGFELPNTPFGMPLTAVKHKRYSHTDHMVTDTFPLSLNRYDPLCIHSEGDDTPVSTEESVVAKPKHARKHRVDHKKRVLERNNIKLL
jgi:hypothetical protein